MITLEEATRAANARIPSPELRFKIYARDGYKCLYCGRERRKSLTIDHIWPYSLGGLTIPCNLQTLCSDCNSRKENKIL